MEYRKLGSTGVDVSRTSLGMMSFGTPDWQKWVLPGEHAERFVRHALELGINLFDTADFYSWGLSEIALGESIARLTDRSKVVISTKAGLPMHGGPNGGGLSRKRIFDALDASLRRLGTDYVDVYMLHHPDAGTPIEETVDALDAVVRSGRARYVGVSNFSAWQLARAERRMGELGMRDFAVVQLQYNLAYREEERELLPYAESAGVGTMIYSPLARGVLARAAQSELSEVERRRADGDAKAKALYGADVDGAVVAALRAVSADLGAEPASVALAWVLSKPAVTSVLSGAVELAHLDAAAAAFDLQLDDDTIRRLEEPYRPQSPKTDQLDLAGGSATPSAGWWHKDPRPEEAS